MAIIPIVFFLYWLIFVVSGDAAWKLFVVKLTERGDTWLSWIVPFWDSLPSRHVSRWPYPTVAHAHHVVAIAWLSIYATIAYSFVFMLAFVHTAVAAGREDLAVAQNIRLIVLTSWLVFAVALLLSWTQGIPVRSHRGFMGPILFPIFTIVCAYCTILWICALLAHRQLGDRWRDFKGPS